MKVLRLAVLGLGLAALTQSAEAPAVPEAVKVKILKIQLQQVQLGSEFAQYQAKLAEIQKQYPETQKALAAAENEAYTEAKVKREDWTLDMTKLEFVAVPKPEAKKP